MSFTTTFTFLLQRKQGVYFFYTAWAL